VDSSTLCVARTVAAAFGVVATVAGVAAAAVGGVAVAGFCVATHIAAVAADTTCIAAGGGIQCALTGHLGGLGIAAAAVVARVAIGAAVLLSCNSYLLMGLLLLGLHIGFHNHNLISLFRGCNGINML